MGLVALGRHPTQGHDGGEVVRPGSWPWAGSAGAQLGRCTNWRIEARVSMPPYSPTPPMPGAPMLPASKPSNRSRWIGLGVIGLGLVFILVGFTVLVVSPGPESYQRVTVPGQRSMELKASHEYTLYFEYPGAQSHSRKSPDVTVVAPDGESEPILPVPALASTYQTTLGRSRGPPVRLDSSGRLRCVSLRGVRRAHRQGRRHRPVVGGSRLSAGPARQPPSS